MGLADRLSGTAGDDGNVGEFYLNAAGDWLFAIRRPDCSVCMVANGRQMRPAEPLTPGTPS